jgi:hypothetical protein
MQATITYNSKTDFYIINSFGATINNRRHYHFDATMQHDELVKLLSKTSNLSCQTWQDLADKDKHFTAKITLNGTKFRNLVSRINTISHYARKRSMYLMMRDAYQVVHNAPYMASYK